MAEFEDSDSDDLEAMFPDSPDPDHPPVQLKQKQKQKASGRGSSSLSKPASLGPTISKSLKPLYVSLLKKEVFIFSATISDENTRIVPDGQNLLKEMQKDEINHKIMQKLAEEFLIDLRREIPFTEYKKPRYIFVNNLLKPILISFVPHGADLDKKMWFEGTTMSLKASLKCSLPLVNVTDYDELEKLIKTCVKQYRQSQL